MEAGDNDGGLKRLNPYRWTEAAEWFQVRHVLGLLQGFRKVTITGLRVLGIEAVSCKV